MSEPSKLAGREVFYLARVGGFRYLDAVYEALKGPHGVEPPAVPSDAGLSPCGCDACRHGPGKNRRGHNLGAFTTYAAAEREALAQLERVTDPAELEHVCKRLGDGLAEGEHVRRTLIAKGQPVPGRGVWLLPVDRPTAREDR